MSVNVCLRPGAGYVCEHRSAARGRKGEIMSFSGDLRKELSKIIPPRRQARETAAAALLINIGKVSRSDKGGIFLTLSGGNPMALRKYFTLIQKNVNISTDLFAPWLSGCFAKSGERRKDAGEEQAGTKEVGKDREKEGNKIKNGQNTSIPDAVFQLSGTEMMPGGETEDSGTGLQILPRQYTAFAEKVGMIGRDGSVRDNDGTLPAEFVKGTAGRAYLREMFLCMGFMNDPKKRYHLEFRCFSQPQADQLRAVLGEQGIHAGLTLRKKYFVVYLKDSEDIVMLLQLMGASVSLMAMENARIYKEVRNNVNRRVNCETANIGKTVESAVRQLEDIRLLRDKGILQELPAQIREAAALREEYPGASLSELGELADPPVGRSGMNHRMRKIASLAKKVQKMQ